MKTPRESAFVSLATKEFSAQSALKASAQRGNINVPTAEPI